MFYSLFRRNSMNFRQMFSADIEKVVPIYVEYYNVHEGREWTPEKAYKRIHQTLSREDSFALMVEDKGQTLGFAMGFKRMYDDIESFYLEEIVIASEYQHKGYGSALLREIERRVKEMGVAMVELDSVNDEMHHHFYGKAGYKNTTTLQGKSKWF